MPPKKSSSAPARRRVASPEPTAATSNFTMRVAEPPSSIPASRLYPASSVSSKGGRSSRQASSPRAGGSHQHHHSTPHHAALTDVQMSREVQRRTRERQPAPPRVFSASRRQTGTATATAQPEGGLLLLPAPRDGVDEAQGECTTPRPGAPAPPAHQGSRACSRRGASTGSSQSMRSQPRPEAKPAAPPALSLGERFEMLAKANCGSYRKRPQLDATPIKK